MNILNLPQDIIASVIDNLYDPPDLVPRDGSYPACLGEHHNQEIVDLALVCKAFYNYTYALRFEFVRCDMFPIDPTRFVSALKRSERLQQSIRHLYLANRIYEYFPNDPSFLDVFPELLPNLNSIRIGISSHLGHHFMTRLAGCANLRSLAIDCYTIDDKSIPALQNLRLQSLDISIFNQPFHEALPILDILSGSSCKSLENLRIDCANKHFERYGTIYPMTMPLLESFPALRMLYVRSPRIKLKRKTLSYFSHCAPGIEKLVVRPVKAVVIDPDGSGSWLRLKEVTIEYDLRPGDEAQEEYLLSCAPALTKAYLWNVPFRTFTSLCRSMSVHRTSQLCELSMHITPIVDATLTPGDIERLASGLGNLRALKLTTTSTDWSCPVVRFTNINDCILAFAGMLHPIDISTRSLIHIQQGFSSLSKLTLNVDISHPHDAYRQPTSDVFMEALEERCGDLLREICVLLANTCPTLGQIEWSLMGYKHWIICNLTFIRKEGEAVDADDIDIEVELKSY